MGSNHGTINRFGKVEESYNSPSYNRGKLMKMEENIELPIFIKEKNKKRTAKQSLMLASVNAPHNDIFNWSLLNEPSIILSLRYLLMKFEIEKGIISIRRD